VKLLLDQNLSPRLVRTLEAVYATADIEAVLKERQPSILEFCEDDIHAFLALS
jgi:predicted nuclease of predicted toxin-antitoxin system